MRVLTVGNMHPPHHLGGYELVWRSAVEHLRARGHAVTVLTSDHRQPGVGQADPPGVHRDLRWWWRDHAWPSFSLRERLALERHNARVVNERLDADRPDVVAWWAMGGMSLSLLEQVRARGLPAVGFVHDEWLLYGPRVDRWLRTWSGAGRVLAAPAARLTGVPTRVALDHVARWVFVSEHVRDRARQAGLLLPRSEVAPSGIAAEHLAGPAPVSDWAWRLLSVGRIDERKGIDTAIEALARLPAAATLVVAGEGDPRTLAALRALAQRRGVAGRVDFAGPRSGPQLRELYAGADAVVFGVRWEEPWGLVPLEAMAAGRPVAATGTGGSAEYLRDGENCLLFAPGDAGALAAALTRLAADPDLRGRLRAGGLATAARHTAAAFERRVEELLAEEVARGRG